MPRSAAPTRFRLASSFRQSLDCLMRPAARLTFAEPLRRAWWVANEKSLLHLGDDLAGYFELCADPVDAVGVQPDDRLSHGDRWIELIRDRDPVLAMESSLCEPAANLAPKARIMRPLALNMPAKAGPAVAGGGIIDADDPQVLEPSARPPEQQAGDGRLVFRSVNGQVQRRKRVGDHAIRALGTSGLVHDRRRDRRETIDQLEEQYAATVGELLAAKAIDRKAK